MHLFNFYLFNSAERWFLKSCCWKALVSFWCVLFPPSFLLLSGQTIKPCCINGWAWRGPHYFPRAVKEKERAGIPMCLLWGNVASSPDKNAGFSLTMFSRMWVYSSISWSSLKIYRVWKNHPVSPHQSKYGRDIHAEFRIGNPTVVRGADFVIVIQEAECRGGKANHDRR